MLPCIASDVAGMCFVKLVLLPLLEHCELLLVPSSKVCESLRVYEGGHWNWATEALPAALELRLTSS